jgi:hypothetical protein
MIKGFHVCKPGNAPTVGQVKSFIISGDRIKSKKAEEGGQNYTIVSVTPRDSYKDSYGNVGYDIEIEPATGQQSTQAPAQRAATGNGNDDRSNRIERQHSQEMALRYFALSANGQVPDTKKLTEMISWFQRDVGRSPEKESEDVF